MEQNNQMRLDKWLWAARFFKTRALAQKHIELGRVLVNDAKVKNSKQIQAKDTLTLTLNALPFKLTVLALNHQRRPATEVKKLYAEDEVTIAKRMEMLALAKAMKDTDVHTDGRPTKRDRRNIDKFKDNW